MRSTWTGPADVLNGPVMDSEVEANDHTPVTSMAAQIVNDVGNQLRMVSRGQHIFDQTMLKTNRSPSRW